MADLRKTKTRMTNGVTRLEKKITDNEQRMEQLAAEMSKIAVRPA